MQPGVSDLASLENYMRDVVLFQKVASAQVGLTGTDDDDFSWIWIFDVDMTLYFRIKV